MPVHPLSPGVIPLSELIQLVAADLAGLEQIGLVVGDLVDVRERYAWPWAVVTDEEVEAAVVAIDPEAVGWFQTHTQTAASTNFLAVPARTVAGSVPWRGVKHDGDVDRLVDAIAGFIRLWRKRAL